MSYFDELPPDLKAALAGRSKAPFVAVTGASGLIGGGIVDFFRRFGGETRFLLQSRSRERLVERHGEAWLRTKGVEVFEGRCDALPTQGVDVVFHAAAPASPKSYLADRREAFRAIFEDTHALLRRTVETATDVLFVSSGDVYGEVPNEPITEEWLGSIAVDHPRAVYAESKRLAEASCAAFFREFGVRTFIVRPFNVYGPGQRLDDGRFVADLVNSMLLGRAFEARGNLENLRAFCFLSDAVESIVRAWLFGRPARPYNIGNRAAEAPLRELLKAAEAALPGWLSATQRTTSEYERGTFGRCCPSTARGESECGFRTMVPFAEGLRRTIAWHRAR